MEQDKVEEDQMEEDKVEEDIVEEDEVEEGDRTAQQIQEQFLKAITSHPSEGERLLIQFVVL